MTTLKFFNSKASKARAKVDATSPSVLEAPLGKPVLTVFSSINITLDACKATKSIESSAAVKEAEGLVSKTRKMA